MCHVMSSCGVSCGSILIFVGTEPSTRQHYVMSIHSSKALMVEELDTKPSKYSYALADAIIQLAVTEGKREGVSTLIRDLLSYMKGSENELLNLLNVPLTYLSKHSPTNCLYVYIVMLEVLYVVFTPLMQNLTH